MDQFGLSSGREHHPIGHSSHKNSYRQGVREGNYAEEVLARDAGGRPYLLDRGAAFDAATTFRAAFTPEGKSGAALAAGARRQDIVLKYCKYGRSQVMPDEKTAYFASSTHLAYEGAGGAAAGACAGGAQPAAAAAAVKVQDCLWGASKFDNRKVPVSVQACSASAERQRQLQAEAAASPYVTVEKERLEAAAQDPAARAAARPPLAQPRDAEGEGTQVGRRASGPFKASLDKDYLKTGLRRP